jgi:hypothetical protein
LTAQDSKVKLSNEQKIAFLKKAEAKVASETKWLNGVVVNLGELYYTTGQFERAAEYLNRQYTTASADGAKDAILPKLLDASLRGSRVDLAIKLIEECLAKEDLSPDNVVIVTINNFMSKPSGANPDAVLTALSNVKFSGDRPNWQKWLQNLTVRLGKGKEAEKPKEGANANKA